MRMFLSLALMCVLGAGVASAQVEVGDAGPNFKFEKSWNFEPGIDELQDLRGKVVLVERWATWCGPCMAQIPHLTEIHEKFNERGFVICSVSDEPTGTIQSGMIDAKKPPYGIVAAKIGELYQTSGIPHAWVIDPEGKCVWKGHPGGLNNEMIEKWVENVAPTKVNKELNRALKGAVKAFDSGELGKALTEAKEVGDKTEDLAVKSDADYLESLVQKHIDLNNAKRERAKEGGDLVALGVALEEAANKFKGHEIGEKADTELKELKKSKEFKDTLDAHKELEKIKPYLKDYRPSAARKKLEKIASKYPDTPAGKEAAELAKQFVD